VLLTVDAFPRAVLLGAAGGGLDRVWVMHTWRFVRPDRIQGVQLPMSSALVAAGRFHGSADIIEPGCGTIVPTQFLPPRSFYFFNAGPRRRFTKTGAKWVRQDAFFRDNVAPKIFTASS